MANEDRISIAQLILIPSIITLAVTLLRLTGELLHWSKVLFNPDAGGGGALIGISWLAPVFGIYFGIRLANAERRPPRVLVRRAEGDRDSLLLWIPLIGIKTGIVGFVFLFFGSYIAFFTEEKSYPKLVAGLLIMIIAAAIQYPVWPRLFKTLIAYAYAARIPVVIVMYLALQGNWGTHYDAAPPPPKPPAPPLVFPNFFSKFLFLALIPQLILWIAFTICTGTVFGSIAAAIFGRRRAGEAVATPA
jgi:hypothetical protein